MSEKIDFIKESNAIEGIHREPSLEFDEGAAYKAAFGEYLRNGADKDLAFLEKKAFRNGEGDDGGFLVTPYILEALDRMIHDASPMRQLATVTKISIDSLEVIDGATFGQWANDDTAIAAPDIGKRTVSAHEVIAQPKTTQKLLDDLQINIEEWLLMKVFDVFSRTENTAFISGDGTGKPKGILDYAAGTSWGQIEQLNSGTAGQVDADDIIELYYSLKEEYSTRATFLMNRDTAQQVKLLKETTTNQYLWQPSLAAGAPDTLLGVPVVQASDMPSVAQGCLPIALGDFSRAYQIVDRTGVRVLRDPYTEKPFVKFYTTKRVGGDVVNFEAIKLLKIGDN